MVTESEFYEASYGEALEVLRSSKNGLVHQEAIARLKKYGFNKLEEKKRTTAFQIFLNQFKNPLVIILIVAALVSAFIEYVIDAAVIFSIILLNAILGFVQEYKAEKAVEALKKLAAPKATVIRDGKQITISSEELVPGDIVVLETGDKVPADIRLIDVINFKVDESALTGESISVLKNSDIIKSKAPLAERKNCAFMNTIVVNGRAIGVVFATGMQTEIGKIATLIETAEDKATPLQRSLADVGKKIGLAVIFISAVVFSLGLFRGVHPLEMFLASISLAVAAVPEGLPAVVTITLAIGVSRMARAKSIIRKLPAVETLGSCSFICCDKTGTLTKNQMTVRQLYLDKKVLDVTGEGYVPEGNFLFNSKQFDVKDEYLLMLLKIGTLCNSATLTKNNIWQITGDPTEASLLVLAQKAGITKTGLLKLYPQISELSFDANRKRMTTIHKATHGEWAFVKGAPDILLEKCKFIYSDGKIKKLTEKDKKQILDKNTEFATQALRVLGFAFRELKGKEEITIENIEKDLVFVGLAGMIDPPRPEVKAALKTCEEAGIKVSMVTGDHKLTATAIGRQLGLIKEGYRILDGEELDNISDSELQRICENVSIYARVTPEHKSRIISALQKKGHIVAMTGDGVNDAPALKTANIGIAMGLAGTDVAKEASAMILEDDNFATIVNAIKEGRNIYDNIKKFLRFLLSSNIGEVFTIFFASLVGLPLPLIAVQLLWMNLLTDGLPAVALAVDPADEDVMRRKPRDPKEPTIDKQMISTILLVGVVITIGVLFLFNYALDRGESLSSARAIAFTAFVMFEMFNVFNTRSSNKSVLSGILSNKWLLAAVASSILLQLAVLYIPKLQTLFGVAPISLIDWIILIGVGVTVIIAEEIRKLVFSEK